MASDNGKSVQPAASGAPAAWNPWGNLHEELDRMMSGFLGGGRVPARLFDFEPLPRYPGYSADFFDEQHYVMLGASWATDGALVRRSFRNWFQPHYPYVFSQFRTVQR